jgi:hypothetical protein
MKNLLIIKINDKLTIKLIKLFKKINNPKICDYLTTVNCSSNRSLQGVIHSNKHKEKVKKIILIIILIKINLF